MIHSGWQSQRFCVYPQDLIIQFPTLVKLSQLTFLLHQFKIPRQIELYYFAQHHADVLNRDMGELGGLDQAGRLILQLQQQSQGGSDVNPLFKKLGHFSLDDNMKTNYSARELKTVYVECSCQFLMIRFLKNHPNQQNKFNQVGLVSLKAVGAVIGTYEATALQASAQAANPSGGQVPGADSSNNVDMMQLV